jgi:hypothetical protein
MSKYRVYIWENACNVDYTGGDVMVVADSLEAARKKLGAPDNPRGGFLDIALDTNPNYVFDLGEAGFCWYGPGGA